MSHHHSFPMNGHAGSVIDPNELSMSGNYQTFPQGFNNNTTNGFQGAFGDDELLESLNSPTAEPQAPMHNQGHDFNNVDNMNGMAFSHGAYGSPHHSLPIDQHFSSTPEGEPLHSPYITTFGQFRQLQHPQSFAGSLQSPISYATSPLANGELGNDNSFLKARRGLPQAMQRKPSATPGPMTPKTAAAMGSLSMGSESPFGSQPIRAGAAHHEKTHSGQWIGTPNSLSSFGASGFSSPHQAGMHNITDIMKGGASMPAKLTTSASAVASTEAKRKRRRESHNQVERRRRDNINERIQDLSKLVPLHRLEDEKLRKAKQNGALNGTIDETVPSPPQATSALAGPGARRAAGGMAGNITTGLPIEDKDKGPNKGDILNGAVSWTRDLMWFVKAKIEQEDELKNLLQQHGIPIPFTESDDQKRMQYEVLEAVARTDETTGLPRTFAYSRPDGSGLRVPTFTDWTGKRIAKSGPTDEDNTFSPGDHNGMAHEMLDADFLDYDDEEGAYKEEDEFALGMDMTA
ncbi:microphthalmia-associated transcription factor [Podospora fimiseda]|uniref:Microphthalmia-associated transcription factor n=1 Tax=Podospora fimiseda TaxID=252190 RepID=A0AAN7BP78_9PEZI|nr:microphthalmia-associated transcription factor [Podospora fimiseda]